MSSGVAIRPPWAWFNRTSCLRSGAMRLHGRMEVEDVPVRVTHVEGTMAPGLGRQLLDPLQLQAFQAGVLPVNILDFELNQDAMIRRASHGRDPKGLKFGLAPQGECTGLQGKFDIVATRDLRLNLQYLLIEGAHRLEIGGDGCEECKLHQVFPSSHRGDMSMADHCSAKNP